MANQNVKMVYIQITNTFSFHPLDLTSPSNANRRNRIPEQTIPYHFIRFMPDYIMKSKYVHNNNIHSIHTLLFGKIEK